MKKGAWIFSLFQILCGSLSVLGQITNEAPNPPGIGSPPTPPLLDVEKVAPSLQLPAPWSPMSPSTTLKLKLLWEGLSGSNAGGIQIVRGYVHGKDAHVNFFTGEFLVVGVSLQSPSPEILLAGYRKLMQQGSNTVSTNMNGIISNLKWDPPVWNASLESLVGPVSWQTFDGSTARERFYFIPTKEYVIALAAFGGTKNSDQIFADVEQSLAKLSIPVGAAEPPTWGQQMALLAKQDSSAEK